MTDTDRDLLPEGLEDRLPPAAAVSARMTRAIMDSLDSHGYAPVQPPAIEFEASLASRMAGIEPRRMFRFVDPASLRTLAMRSDMTPQLGRIAATRLAGAPRPLRLCYAGQVLTIAGAGLDPAREHLQIGAELIGSDTVAATGEVVEMAIAALHAAGATGVSIDFTLPDLVDVLAAQSFAGAAMTPEQIAAVRRELDAKDAGALVAVGGGAFLPLLYATGPFASAIARLSTILTGNSAAAEALASRIEGLRAIAARVAGMARLTLDPTERHGFEYQSWFGFTIYAEGLRGALGRGGSYHIMDANGALRETATGFSLYPDPLVAALAAKEQPRDMLFLPLGHDAACAAQLRGAGWRTLAALSAEDDARLLGCTHRLEGDSALAL